MGARLLVYVGVLFGGFYFIGNVLLIIESIVRGQSFVGAAITALIAGAIGAVCIWVLSLKSPDEERDPYGRAQFEQDRKEAEKAGLK
jgi:uncharacterized membrane protein YqjE